MNIRIERGPVSWSKRIFAAVCVLAGIVILARNGESPQRDVTADRATIQPAMVATDLPAPSRTSRPTRTPAPTQTPLPTRTPIATRVPGTGFRGGTDANPVFFGDGLSREVDPPWWPCKEGQIKGNQTSHIYHVPSGSFYAKTFDDVQCFASAADAVTAGYRASER